MILRYKILQPFFVRAILLLLLPVTIAAQSKSIFPLKLSDSKRHLVDNLGKPFR